MTGSLRGSVDGLGLALHWPVSVCDHGFYDVQQSILAFQEKKVVGLLGRLSSGDYYLGN